MLEQISSGPLAGAGPASPVTAAVEAGVLRGVFVPARTVGLASVAVVAGVREVWEKPKMPRVAARADTAHVVDGHPGRDGADLEHVRDSMRKPHGDTIERLPVAVGRD